MAAFQELKDALKIRKVNDELFEYLISSLRYLVHYEKQHDTLLPNREKIYEILERTLTIADKMPSNIPLSDGKLQQDKNTLSDEDVTEPVVERYIRLETGVKIMTSSKRDMYVCFSENEIRFLEDYARRIGALNISQALESLLNESKKEN